MKGEMVIVISGGCVFLSYYCRCFERGVSRLPSLMTNLAKLIGSLPLLEGFFFSFLFHQQLHRNCSGSLMSGGPHRSVWSFSVERGDAFAWRERWWSMNKEKYEPWRAFVSGTHVVLLTKTRPGLARPLVCTEHNTQLWLMACAMKKNKAFLRRLKVRTEASERTTKEFWKMQAASRRRHSDGTWQLWRFGVLYSRSARINPRVLLIAILILHKDVLKTQKVFFMYLGFSKATDCSDFLRYFFIFI